MKTLSAGVPNIKGQFTIRKASGDGSMNNVLAAGEGAFSLKYNSGEVYANNLAINTGNTFKNDTMEFNANTYSPIYNSSKTVQPPALQLIPQIRY